MSSTEESLFCQYCGGTILKSEDVVFDRDKSGQRVAYHASECRDKSVSIDWCIPTVEPVLLGTTRKDFLNWLDSYQYVAPSKVGFAFQKLDNFNFPGALSVTYEVVQLIAYPGNKFHEKSVPIRIDMSVEAPTRLKIHPYVKAWGRGRLPSEKMAANNLAALRKHLDHLVMSAQEAFPQGQSPYQAKHIQGTAVPVPNDQALSPELRDYLKVLRQKIGKRFNREELRGLCADLIGDYKEIEREDWAAFVRELTLWCVRHEQLPQLIELLKEKRPTETWDNF